MLREAAKWPAPTGRAGSRSKTGPLTVSDNGLAPDRKINRRVHGTPRKQKGSWVKSCRAEFDVRKIFVAFFADGRVAWLGEAISEAHVADAMARDDEVHVAAEDIKRLAIQEITKAEAARLWAWIHDGARPSRLAV